MSNRIFTGDLTNKKITIKTYAKSLATSGQSFKIRVKAVVNGNNSFVPSSEFNLTNEYPQNPFEFEYIIPDNTSSIQVQVMLGNDQGSYFLDDFETSIESAEPLSNEEIIAIEVVWFEFIVELTLLKYLSNKICLLVINWFK